jgi:hypothetical protein
MNQMSRQEDLKGIPERVMDECGDAGPVARAAPKLSDDERKVLRYLATVYEEYCVPFAPICRGTKLSRPRVRLACRSLTRKGLARFASGLWHEFDGTPAGSGYGHTMAGLAAIKPPKVARERERHSSPRQVDSPAPGGQND